MDFSEKVSNLILHSRGKKVIFDKCLLGYVIYLDSIFGSKNGVLNQTRRDESN